MLKLRTRTEMWKSYRTDINKNILLQKAVLISNKKLSILYNRLIDVYPDYKLKHNEVDIEKINDINIKTLKDPILLSTDDLETITKQIDDFENEDDHSFKFLDNISFSSGNLDDVINAIKEGKISKMDYIKTSNNETQIIRAKKVVLAKGGKNE